VSRDKAGGSDRLARIEGEQVLQRYV